MREKGYVVLDWTASGLSFLTLWLVYRASNSLTVLGDSGWLLNLLSTSLFLSGAAQVFAMMRKRGIGISYGAFVPLVLLEIAVLRLFVNGFAWGLLATLLSVNLLFAVYRGSLMGTGKLASGALWNLYEQALRSTLVGVLCFFYHKDPGQALLMGTAIAYSIVAISVAIAIWKQGVASRPFPARHDLLDAAWFALVHLGVYVLVSFDVLVLKNHADLKSQFSLLKPWGQVVYIGATPFINVYLSRRLRGESVRRPLYALAIFAGLYLCVVLLLAPQISYFLFGYSVSGGLATLVVVEHLLMAVLVTLFYRGLMERTDALRTFVATLLCLLLLAGVPIILPKVWVYAGVTAAYAIACSLLFVKRIPKRNLQRGVTVVRTQHDELTRTKA